jgi:hypothetical protein
MSSLPLISHHLFVAAVSDKSWIAGVSDWNHPHPPPEEPAIRELPLEVLDFRRSFAARAAHTMDELRRVGST